MMRSALLFTVLDKNRGWWAGTIMDEVDAMVLLKGKFGPTVLQVDLQSLSL